MIVPRPHPGPGRAAALLSVVSFRVLLRILPYRAVRALIARGRREGPRTTGSPPSPDDIAASVRSAARRVPGATRFVQAHAAAWLLARAGIHARVRFGVRRTNEALDAHAWLETEGRVLLDGELAMDIHSLGPFFEDQVPRSWASRN